MRRAAVLRLLAVPLLAACDVGVSVDLDREVARERVETTEPVEVLRVRTEAAAVEVVGVPGTTTTVSATLRWSGERPSLRQHYADGVLDVTPDCDGARRCSVELRVEVPADADVDLETDVGELRLDGLGGDVEARSDAGRIHGTDLRAPEVTARSSAGEVDLTFVTAPTAVLADTSAGAVTVRVPATAAYAVDADTSVGSSEVDVPMDPAAPHAVTVRTSVGSVRVLPS